MEQASVELARVSTDAGECLECRILVSDPALIGHKATLVLEQRVTVKDTQPVHARRELFRQPLVLSEEETRIPLDPARLQAFSYRGSKIDLELHTILTVDDGILFDTKLTERQELELGGKPSDLGNTSVVDPKDSFQFFANLAALPLLNQMFTLVLAVVASVVILVNTLVGIHDQFVPESATYFYSHYDSDGDTTSPFATSLAGSGVVGAGLWVLMRTQLRKYMSFHFARLPVRFQSGTSLPVSSIVAGRSRVPLVNATLQIVACNFEKGQYERVSGSGKRRRKRVVSFQEPARALVLFRKTVPLIPAHAPISRFFPESVSFDPMFQTLLPPQRVGKYHGLEIHWEVQLLHDEFVDQELVGPIEGFCFEDFVSEPIVSSTAPKARVPAAMSSK